MHSAELADDIGFLLARASGLVSRACNAALSPHGLRVRSYSVLMLVTTAEDEVSQRDLAAAAGLDPSQVVLLVDELAAAGLVQRMPSRSDRRANVVTTTALGRKVRRAASRDVGVALEAELRILSDSDRDLLRLALQRLTGLAAGGAEPAPH